LCVTPFRFAHRLLSGFLVLATCRLTFAVRSGSRHCLGRCRTADLCCFCRQMPRVSNDSKIRRECFWQEQAQSRPVPSVPGCVSLLASTLRLFAHVSCVAGLREKMDRVMADTSLSNAQKEASCARLLSDRVSFPLFAPICELKCRH